MATTHEAQPALKQLGQEIREAGWELAQEVIQEGLADDAIPSLARMTVTSQLGDVPTFISELAREVEQPQPGRMRRGSPLAALARDHAREREALGFAPREIVTELLILRRVLWRFVSRRVAAFETGDILTIERRLNDTIDKIVTECVVAYFDRATAELADQARSDPLTGLLNHQALTDILDSELVRAERYDHGLTFVFFDLDEFKRINDTLGHVEGDAVLRAIARLVEQILRGSDLAGRMGGDEFAVLLLESDAEAGPRFLSRLEHGVAKLVGLGQLPLIFSFSAGHAHYPTESHDADGLLRLADARQYQAKRAKQP